jgi:hypothetical protein
MFRRFSEWLESMRKDVECTIGILKVPVIFCNYNIPTVSAFFFLLAI